MTPTYPEECPQSYVTEFSDEQWWIEDDFQQLQAGQLLLGYVHHVDQIPMALVAKGRTEATSHDLANCKIIPVNTKNIFERSQIPVASLPCYSRELRTVYRAKKKPVLLIASPNEEPPRHLMKDKPKHLTNPTALIAPYYGRDDTGSRSGYTQAFVNRVRCCEYPQFMWDMLPLEGSHESILRLDHLLPMSTHYIAYKKTGWRLSQEAFELVMEWFEWYYTGFLVEGKTDSKDKYLPLIREDLLPLVKNA